MSKKVRKKKELENETYDILQLDEKIKKLIQEETKKIDQYKKRIDEIQETLKVVNKSDLSDRSF